MATCFGDEMKTASSASALSISIFLALAFGVGCGGGAGSLDPAPLVERLSVPPDSRVFSLAELTHEETVRSWSFNSPADADQWQVAPTLAKNSVNRHGLCLSPTDVGATRMSLTAAVNFQAKDVSVIDVTFKNATHVNSLLYWAGPDGNFSPKRRARVSETIRKGGQVRVARFRVDEETRWKGKIRHLKIEPAIESETEFCIASVAAVQDQVIPSLVDTVWRRPWKVDLNHTIRNALVAFPGRPWITEVEVPKGGATLRFVPGIPKGIGKRVKFTVHVLREDGAQQELFAKRYGGTPEYKPGWQGPVGVSLDSFKGQTVQLAFEVTGIDRIRRKVGLAAWGNLQMALIHNHRPSAPNIVFICLDTVRADHLSSYGYGRQTTPNIDRWAANSGVLFETTVAPSPWTLPSHISMFTGLDAIRHGANYRLPARAEFEMIAERFADEGYETIAWTGGGYLGPGYALHQGFETYNYWLGPKQREVVENVEQTIEWLSHERERPFFLFLHTYEVHEPYFERQPFYDRFAEESGRPKIPSNWVATRRQARMAGDGFLAHKEVMMSPDHGRTWDPIPSGLKDSVIDRYDAGLAFTDAHIGKVLDAIEAQGKTENTVVLLTSDHGEGLGENGMSGHSYLYDFNILVPLIIAAPGSGWPQGYRVSEQVRSVDIVPTLLDLAGLEIPEGIDGETLAPLLKENHGNDDRPGWSYAASSNRGIALRTAETKYIFNNTAWRPAFGTEQLFHLSADPSESENLATNRHDQTEAFRKMVTDKVSREAVGIWIHLQNPADGAMALELRGIEVASPARLKAVAFPGAGLEYINDSDPRAVAEIPGRAEAILYSEATGEAQVSVTVRLPGESTEGNWRLRIEDIVESPWSVRLKKGSWVEGRGAAASTGAAITVYTSGAFGEEVSPETMTDEIQDQLKALGYIE